MRINTPCFKGFCNMVEDLYGIPTGTDDCNYDFNGCILEWYDDNLVSRAEAYEYAWNDAAKSYNSFR